MRAQKASRFIGLATPSVADSRDGRHWKLKVLPVMARLTMPNALKELNGMPEAVTSSGLGHTIARVTNPPTSPRPAGSAPAEGGRRARLEVGVKAVARPWKGRACGGGRSAVAGP
ncbi:hypothetical protein [Streptomyces sp. ISL-12]|uniref:hypothetical protein n=1 Tax=Streptomyces sp. ISL-12 TaxID=2819177 RepID=UPI00203595C7|nr:hypothetical protein [Streptomyces sp. ISL-12]